MSFSLPMENLNSLLYLGNPPPPRIMTLGVEDRDYLSQKRESQVLILPASLTDVTQECNPDPAITFPGAVTHGQWTANLPC